MDWLCLILCFFCLQLNFRTENYQSKASNFAMFLLLPIVKYFAQNSTRCNRGLGHRTGDLGFLESKFRLRCSSKEWHSEPYHGDGNTNLKCR